VFLLLGLGAAAGLLAGMFGVGGGFLATPLLIFVGIPPAVAVASQANQVVANSVSSLQVQWRRGNVDFRMGLVLLVGGLLGSAAGLVAGFSRGRLDAVIMTVADAQLAFPFILLAIGIIAVLGPSFPTLVVVIGLSGWVSYARILRSQVLVLRSREFVESIHALGGSLARVVLRHVLPNVLSSIVVIATLELARAIVLEATLSFLGLGIQPPTPSWGGMVQEGREYLDSAWWISTFPGIVLMITSIVVSRTGDWLRDVLDPTLRGE
jgi:peptide/nickel transport system permease protein